MHEYCFLLLILQFITGEILNLSSHEINFPGSTLYRNQLSSLGRVLLLCNMHVYFMEPANFLFEDYISEARKLWQVCRDLTAAKELKDSCH